MWTSTRPLLAAGLIALTARVSAQVASVCPSTNVCFKLNIPANTASSGSGDVFFQISAPSTYEWVALGQGKGMAGSNMFLVYTSSSGTNVTLSPRTASGYVTPSINKNAQVTLLEGSGVSNGVMTANVKCSNCNSWSGGTMDFKASTGSWIYAYQSSGGPKNADDQSASIKQHNNQAAFSWDFANAKGGSSVNPLVNAAPAASGSSSGSGGVAATSCIQRSAVSATGSATGAAANLATSGAQAAPTQSIGNPGSNSAPIDWRTIRPSELGSWPTARPTSRPFDARDDLYVAKRQALPYCDELTGGGNNGNSNSNSNTNAGFTPLNASQGGPNRQAMLIAHGVLASLAFVILFPAGAIAIRLATFPGVVWLHAAFQIFAYIVYIAAFGLGVYMATKMKLLNAYHPIIGIVVLVALFFQPILGFLHHLMFKKYQHRTLWSYAHIWLGRIAVTLGIINGGLGLRLANSMHMSSQKGIIAYGVVAGFMWLAWVAASVIGERRRKVAGKNAPPKYRENRHGSGESAGGSESDAAVPVEGHFAPKER